VIRRRHLRASAGVTALLAVAGIASRGRPLSGGSGGGPTSSFFDYLYTTVGLVFVATVLVALYLVLKARMPPDWRPRGRWHMLSSIAVLIVFTAVAMYLIRHGFLERLQKAIHQHAANQPAQHGPRTARAVGDVRNARARWDEIAIVLALLAGAAAFMFATRRTQRGLWRLPTRSHEAVSLALDESLDDLRDEPDLRRAIIAAYARMERALARAGTPRLPAEAPLEYLERALLGLDTSATAVRRLTDLFEWAKFSHHEPEPQMRDEAIAALVAVRDELRQPREAAAA
jgi:hypothetical protein